MEYFFSKFTHQNKKNIIQSYKSIHSSAFCDVLMFSFLCIKIGTAHTAHLLLHDHIWGTVQKCDQQTDLKKTEKVKTEDPLTSGTPGSPRGVVQL